MPKKEPNSHKLGSFFNINAVTRGDYAPAGYLSKQAVLGLLTLTLLRCPSNLLRRLSVLFLTRQSTWFCRLLLTPEHLRVYSDQDIFLQGSSSPWVLSNPTGLSAVRLTGLPNRVCYIVRPILALPQKIIPISLNGSFAFLQRC